MEGAVQFKNMGQVMRILNKRHSRMQETLDSIEKAFPGGDTSFFLKFWGFPQIVGFPQISSPNFPKFPKIHFGRSLLRLRDLGARL